MYLCSLLPARAATFGWLSTVDHCSLEGLIILHIEWHLRGLSFERTVFLDVMWNRGSDLEKGSRFGCSADPVSVVVAEKLEMTGLKGKSGWNLEGTMVSLMPISSYPRDK